MNEKILISKKTNIGTLNQFLDLIKIMRDEFDLYAFEIGETTNDNRNMFVTLEKSGMQVSIDYKYYYEEMYINVICNDDCIPTVNLIVSRLKDLVK